MSERTLQIIDATRARLHAAGSRILTARLLAGAVTTVSCLAAFWFAAALMEATFWLAPTPRLTIVVAGAIGVTIVGAVYFAVPVFRRVGILRSHSPEEIAERVEAAVPPARDRLMAFLHLAGGKHTSSPREMVEEALHALYEPFSETPFDRVETYGGLRRALKFGAIPLVLLATFILAAPGPFGAATDRLLEPMTAFVRPAPFVLSVSPGDVEVLRGDSVAIRVAVVGRSEVAPLVEIKRTSENLERIQPGSDENEAEYVVIESNIRQPFEYRAIADDVASKWYRVTVLERPLVRQLAVTVNSPRYSRIGSVRLDPDVGDVTALRGSMIDVTVSMGGEKTVAAEIAFDDGSRVPLTLEDAAASGRFRLTRAGTYHVELVTADGIRNDNPIEYRLELVNDSRPSVVIVSPELVAELAEPFEINLLARIIDDFGFSKMSLLYRLAESRFGIADETFREIPIDLEARFELDQVIAHEWSVSNGSREPVPGDVIEYFLRIWDNDSYAGFKSADSPKHRLIMPSLAERYREMNEAAEDASDRLEDFVETADDIDDRFQELRKELQQKPESDWDDKRRLDQIESMQKQLEQNIENVSSGLQDLAEKMQENSLVSEETLEMFEQLRKAIDEINSPELMEALQKLRESMQSLDLQQMQESMNDFEFNEDQFKERLKRALDLFKRLQAYQGLEEAARRAEELAKRQEEIREATSTLAEENPPGEQTQTESDTTSAKKLTDEQDPSETADDSPDSNDGESAEQSSQEDETERKERSESDPSESDQNPNETLKEQLAAEQKRSEEEMRDLEKRLQEIQEMMDEMPQNAGQKLDQLREELRQQELPEEMQKNAEQIMNEELQPAMEGQQQMQQQLSRLQEQLSQMQQNMRGNQLQLNIAGLRQVLNDILVLSQQQEETRNDVSSTEADSPSLRNYARLQVELGEGLRVVSDTLQKLSREIPEMSRQVQAETGKALREIQLATESLADRSARRAAGHQKASMMHLNELALLLSDLLNMLMNQQMGMGMPSMQQMLQQMQQMAGQQQQLNQQIQQMLNDMHGQRLTKDMQARMRQLAEQQARIREQLKEMSRNPELRGKALGDLDKIAEQMEETIRQLEHSRVNRELIERQQQILTRLLDASRSINQRGKEDRRESRSGEDQRRESPADLTPEEQVNQLRRDLIRALESGYAQDYEELIRRYFNLLQQELESVPGD